MVCCAPVKPNAADWRGGRVSSPRAPGYANGRPPDTVMPPWKPSSRARTLLEHHRIRDRAYPKEQYWQRLYQMLEEEARKARSHAAAAATDARARNHPDDRGQGRAAARAARLGRSQQPAASHPDVLRDDADVGLATLRLRKAVRIAKPILAVDNAARRRDRALSGLAVRTTPRGADGDHDGRARHARLVHCPAYSRGTETAARVGPSAPPSCAGRNRAQRSLSAKPHGDELAGELPTR